MKVYIVTKGQYSDYGISHIFATRELAQAFLNKYYDIAERSHAWDAEGAHGRAYWGDGDYNDEIDEWEVREEVPPLFEAWDARWEETPNYATDASGRTAYGQPRIGPPTETLNLDIEEKDFEDTVADAEPDFHWSGGNTYVEHYGRTVMTRAHEAERAKKILHDRLAFLKALEEGIA